MPEAKFKIRQFFKQIQTDLLSATNAKFSLLPTQYKP